MTEGFKLRSGLRDWRLKLGEHVIGRSPGCDVVLDDDRVSRRHAALHVTADRVLLEDLGSSNGTLVNGVRLTSAVVLGDGDMITIGSHQLVVTPVGGERRRSNKITRPMPASGTYAAAPRTSPPAPPVPDFDDDSTQTASVFGLLEAAVDKALAQDDLDDAESATSNLFLSVRAGLLRGQLADDEQLLAATVRYGLELAERTGRVKWLDRVFEIHAAAQRLMDWVTIDRIHRLCQRMGFVSEEGLDQYLARMRAAWAELDSEGRQRVARLEELRALG